MIDFGITPEMNKQLQELATATVNQRYEKDLDNLEHLSLDSYKRDTFGLDESLSDPNRHIRATEIISTSSQSINDEYSKVLEDLPKNGVDAIGEYRPAATAKQLDYVVNNKHAEISEQYTDKVAEENDKLQEDVKNNTETKFFTYKQDKADKKIQKELKDIHDAIRIGNTLSYKGANYVSSEASTLEQEKTTLSAKLAGNKKGKEYKDNEEKYEAYLSQEDSTKEIIDTTDKLSLYKQKYVAGKDYPDDISKKVTKGFTDSKQAIADHQGTTPDNIQARDPEYSPDFFPKHIEYTETGRKVNTLKKTSFEMPDAAKKDLVKTDLVMDSQVKKGLSQPRFPNAGGFEHYLENLGNNALNGAKNALDMAKGQGMGVANDLLAAGDDPATKDPLRDYFNKAIGVLNDKYSIDAMDNAFDVYLMYFPDEQTDLAKMDSPLKNIIKPLLKLDKGNGYAFFFKNLTTPTVFGVRVTSITVPQVKLETITYNWLSRDIVKPGKPQMDSTSSFTFRLDQNLFYANIFEQFAGLNNIVVASSNSPAGGNSSGTSSKTPIDTVRKMTSTPRPNAWKDVKCPHLCIYVRLRNLAPAWKKLQKVKGPYGDLIHMTDSSLKPPTGVRNLIDVNDVSPALPDEQMPGYLFEDVNILGSSDVELDTGGGDGSAELTVNFTFRRCYKTRLDASVINNKFKY